MRTSEENVEYQRRYRVANRERLAVAKAKYLAVPENRERARAARKRWAQANQEKRRADGKRWREENRERSVAGQKRWHAANRERMTDRVLRRIYGITLADRNAILAAQGNACAICRAPSPGWKGDWHVDHDHATGLVRGLLCTGCNAGLGRFKDDVDVLDAAIVYLVRSRRPKLKIAQGVKP